MYLKAKWLLQRKCNFASCSSINISHIQLWFFFNYLLQKYYYIYKNNFTNVNNQAGWLGNHYKHLHQVVLVYTGHAIIVSKCDYDISDLLRNINVFTLPLT